MLSFDNQRSTFNGSYLLITYLQVSAALWQWWKESKRERVRDGDKGGDKKWENSGWCCSVPLRCDISSDSLCYIWITNVSRGRWIERGPRIRRRDWASVSPPTGIWPFLLPVLFDNQLHRVKEKERQERMGGVWEAEPSGETRDTEKGEETVMLKMGDSQRWKEDRKEEEEIWLEWEIRERGKSGEDERREERERAGLSGNGVLSDAGRDHLDESGARTLALNPGLHFHVEKHQRKRFKHPFCTFLPPSTQNPTPPTITCHMLVENATGPHYWSFLLITAHNNTHNISHTQ